MTCGGEDSAIHAKDYKYGHHPRRIWPHSRHVSIRWLRPPDVHRHPAIGIRRNGAAGKWHDKLVFDNSVCRSFGYFRIGVRRTGGDRERSSDPSPGANIHHAYDGKLPPS